MLRVTKTHPCPVCQRPDWCLYSADGLAVICQRIQEGSTRRCGDAGFLHFIDPASKPTGKPIRRYVPEPVKDFTTVSAGYQAAITAELIERLALSLDVSIDSLERLCVGWDGESWTFPMRDANRKIIGIRRRFPNGRKFAVKRSTNGLFIPDGLSNVGDLIITEGESDCAAGLDLNFDAIGRPNCNSRIDMTVKFAKGRKITIISDRDRPGIKGAKKLARKLIKHCPAVMIMVPPEGVKDLREWVQKGFNGELQ
ncbi:MAG: toprim domain-containing protein [Planctomycetes bacterium]|nr:toprim domain-containing protein [Planctomycetota bacterium]